MLGAVVAWAIMEPTSLMPDTVVRLSYGQNFAIGLIAGFLIGLLLGIADALSGLSPRDQGRRILVGAGFGAAGGILGIAFGNAVYSAMEGIAGAGPYAQHLPANVPLQARPASESAPGFLTFLLLLFGRGVGWALLGGFIGLSQGVATGSTRKMVNGVVGGIIGGSIGGSAHEIMAWLNAGGVMHFAPGMVRFIDFALTGGGRGLFIGFLEEVRKKAWLRRLVGRNEGKEYLIYKPSTVLGRSELADIPIFGDPDVGERHAAISAQGQRYFIEDLGSFYGTTVNGDKVTREPLKDGDMIEVGKTRFRFRDRATARRFGGAPQSYDAGPKIPNSQHVCPFCGGVKDAGGNCECTVGASATSQQTTVQQNAQVAPPPQADPGTSAPAPSASGQGARLAGLSGPYAGQVFALKSGQTEIGREATKDIGLPLDNTVSRNHSRVVEEAAGWVIYDAGSTNGTFVNGANVQRQELAGGDIVQVGSTKFRFEL